jgi:hypothetical protein
MATTYQDTAGKTYTNRQDAAAANTALGTNPLTKGTTPVAPTPTVTPPPVTTPTTGAAVITPASLQPSAAPVVTAPPVPTAAPKLQADLTAQTEDALAQKNAADLSASTASKNTAFQSYLDQLKSNKGQTTLAAEAYAAPGGVDSITPELNKINDQIRNEQRSLELAKRNVTEKGGGLASGAAGEVSNLERVSLQKQADLSIIQQAVQGRYDSAKTIADRAVAAQFEEQQIKTDAAKFDYTENKDLFTKAEQRQYDMMFTDRQNKIAEAKQNKQDIYDLGIKLKMEGAPTSVMQNVFNAKTREEALALSGNYLGSLDRQLKQAQINSANRANQPQGDQFLSVTEAQALGVPYGTTQSQAFAMGKTPQKPPTAQNETTALYANRLEQSTKILDGLEKYVTTTAAPAFQLQKALPDVLNGMRSSDFQSYDQASRNFINATLRRESGAVISPGEFANAEKQYLPIPGDTPSTLAQKKANRDLATQGFVKGAGSAYAPLTPQPGDTQNTVQSNGGTYVVGQVYNDGTADWVVDAQGNWTKK